MADSANEQRLANELATANDMIEQLGNEMAQMIKDKAYLNSKTKQLNRIVERLEKEKVKLVKEKEELNKKIKLEKDQIPESLSMPEDPTA